MFLGKLLEIVNIWCKKKDIRLSRKLKKSEEDLSRKIVLINVAGKKELWFHRLGIIAYRQWKRKPQTDLDRVNMFEATVASCRVRRPSIRHYVWKCPYFKTEATTKRLLNNIIY